MPVKCNKKAIVDCGDCEDAGKQCVRQTGNTEKCVNLGWSPKTEKCAPQPDCPRPAEINDCQECLDIDAMCFKTKIGKDIAKTCKAKGWKKTTCKEVCEKPTNCEACAVKPSNKSCKKTHKKACKKLAC